jgi:hypothetical protein
MCAESKKVTLINPPSRRAVLRDYYCSTWPKSRYCWQPVDIIAMGSMLHGKARLQVLDCIGMKMDEVDAVSAVSRFAPDAVFALVSPLTLEDDMRILKKLSGASRRIAISGEVALDTEFDFDGYGFIDGLILDFTSRDAAEFLLGGSPAGRVRTKDFEPTIPPVDESFSIGTMPDGFLPNHKYRMPYWPMGFYSIITDFGCPMSCDFCNSGRRCLGYKVRDIDDINGELASAVFGRYDRVYLRSMSFGASRDHDEAVLDLLQGRGLNIHAFMHIEHINERFVKKAKAAGLSLAQVGIESPCEEIRAAHGKSFSNQRAVEAFRMLKSFKILAGAHFLVGLPEEPDDVISRCIELARKMGASYCSINIYSPRAGRRIIPGVNGKRHDKLESAARLAMFRYNAQKYLGYLFHR